MPLPALAGAALAHGLAGLEFGVAIPASLGGAVRMNAGAHGGTLSDGVEAVDVQPPPATTRARTTRFLLSTVDSRRRRHRGHHGPARSAIAEIRARWMRLATGAVERNRSPNPTVERLRVRPRPCPLIEEAGAGSSFGLPRFDETRELHRCVRRRDRRRRLSLIREVQDIVVHHRASVSTEASQISTSRSQWFGRSAASPMDGDRRGSVASDRWVAIAIVRVDVRRVEVSGAVTCINPRSFG
jgi:hypothetical protein